MSEDRKITAQAVIDHFEPGWDDGGAVERVERRAQKLERFRDALIKIMPAEVLLELFMADNDGSPRTYVGCSGKRGTPSGYVTFVAHDVPGEAEAAEEDE